MGEDIHFTCRTENWNFTHRLGMNGGILRSNEIKIFSLILFSLMFCQGHESASVDFSPFKRELSEVFRLIGFAFHSPDEGITERPKIPLKNVNVIFILGSCYITFDANMYT